MKYIKAMALILSLFLLVSCANDKSGSLETVKVSRGNIIAQISSTGTVMPQNRLEIKPPIAGRVESVLVKEGQRVSKGQILAWLSSTERAALLDAARAKGAEELKHWEDVYKPAPVVAPLNGFIIQRGVEPGQTVTVSDAILVMADHLIVKAQVDETDLGLIKLGQKVNIVLDAYPDDEIEGKVEHIAYESELISNVNIYKVDIAPVTVPSIFRSGMSASANFILQDKKDVLLLPLRAVKKSNSKAYVFMKKNGNAELSPVQIQTGLDDSSNTEIASGLNEGDVVYIPTAKMLESLQNQRRRGPVNPFTKKK